MRFTMPNGTVVEPRDDCVEDRDEVMKYLGGTLNIMVHHNKETFRIDQFGELAIDKYSTSMEL